MRSKRFFVEKIEMELAREAATKAVENKAKENKKLVKKMKGIVIKHIIFSFCVSDFDLKVPRKSSGKGGKEKRDGELQDGIEDRGSGDEG